MADRDHLPALGSRRTRRGLRHTWKVTAVGRRYITLTAEFPTGGACRVPVEQWPQHRGETWKPA